MPKKKLKVEISRRIDAAVCSGASTGVLDLSKLDLHSKHVIDVLPLLVQGDVQSTDTPGFVFDDKLEVSTGRSGLFGGKKAAVALRSFESHVVRTLDISGNGKLGAPGIGDLGMLLRSNKHLRHLRMRDVGATRAAMTAFARDLTANVHIERVEYGETRPVQSVYEALPILSPRSPRTSAIGRGRDVADVLFGDDGGSGVAGRRTQQLIEHVCTENRAINRCVVGRTSVLVVTQRAPCRPVELASTLLGVHLTKIVLVNNGLRRLAPEMFERLPALSELNVANNRIDTLPKTIAACRQLRVLDAHRNALRTLPASLAVLGDSLIVLNVAYNRIDEMPDAVVHLKKLCELVAVGNPLHCVPRQVLESGGRVLVNYVRRTRRGVTSVLRGKLIVVGAAATGKTALVNALMDGEHAAATGGMVALQHWALSGSARRTTPDRPAVNVSVWDLSGAEQHHWAHRLFLGCDQCRAAVFIVTFRLDTPPADGELDYWMESVVGGYDAVGARDTPVVLVGTALDAAVDLGMPFERITRTFERLTAGYSKKYPNLAGCFATSTVSMANVDDLRQHLYEVMLAKNTERFARVPRWYLDAENMLPAHVARGDLGALAPLADVAALCDTLGRFTEPDIVGFTEFLQDTGAALCYPDMLECPVVLQPRALADALEWLHCGAGAASIDWSEGTALEPLRSAWPLAGDEQSSRVVEALLRHFDVLVDVGAERYVVPDLLPEQPRAVSVRQLDVDFWGRIEPDRSAHRIYQFARPPVGVFKHLLARVVAVDEFVVQYAWRTGIMVRTHDRQASIMVNAPASARRDARGGSDTRSIEVRVMNRTPGQHVSTLRFITGAFETLLGDALQLEFAVLVPCPRAERAYVERVRQLRASGRGDDASVIQACEDAKHAYTVMQLARVIVGGGDTAECPMCGASSRLSELMPEMTVGGLGQYVATVDADELQLIKEIGQGAFGVVHKAIYRDRLVAVKKIVLDGGSGDNSLEALTEFMGEVWFMQQMQRHANLVNLVGVVRRPYMAVVLEYMDRGSLYNYLFDDVDALADASMLSTMRGRSSRQSSSGGDASPEHGGDGEQWSDGGGGSDVRTTSSLKRSRRRGSRILSRQTSVPGGLRTDSEEPPAAVRGEVGGALPTPVQVKLALDVARGMEYLHRCNMLHRDLKTPNVLVCTDAATGEPVAKVADFGLSVSMAFAQQLTRARVENPVWLAPEVMATNDLDMRRRRYDKCSDVYAFGVILYELCYRRRFFGDVSFQSQLVDMVRRGARPELADDCGVRQELIVLIRDCWAQQADRRPTFRRIVARLVDLQSRLTWKFTRPGEAHAATNGHP